MRRKAGWCAAAVLAATALAAPGSASAAYSLVTSPNAFAGNNVLNGVSAVSGTDAWAVGSLCCSVRHSGLGSLTEHWNGTAWSIVPSPDSLFFDDVLKAVVDISPTNAWAVGEINQSSFKSRKPYIVHWNGSAWSVVSPPSGVTGQLFALSADSASDVWAVGDDQRGHAIALHYNGTSWSSSTLPSAVTSTTLTGVRAFSPTNVWAVGSGVASGTTVVGTTLVLHFNGTSWSAVPSPSPDPNANSLLAIGGFSPTDLWAVGSKGQDEGTTGVPPGTRTLTLHWNGTSWSAVSSPNTGDQDVLTGVAANASIGVATVGSFNNTSGSIPVAKNLALRWTGTTWVNQVTPSVGTSDNLLKGVSAIPGSASYWAVGFHLTPGGPYQTVILRGGAG